MDNKNKSFKPIMWLIWIIEGAVVGFGAILPGISGGTLCVAFGMYRPLIETLSGIKTGLKKYGIMLVFFLVGVAGGFVGLSKLAATLIEKNTALMTCAFIGFIIGTIPELWNDAGTEGRKKGSYISMTAAFAAMLGLLILLKSGFEAEIAPGIPGFLFCGLLWGLSFIVPGLSSSSLLLFFGLYTPMLNGISGFDFSVLIPLGIGMAACVLLLSKAVCYLFKRYYSTVSHAVIGIVAATALAVLPFGDIAESPAANIAALVTGGIVSYLFTLICAKLKAKQ